MIRQAISCDICGSEKRQTNHWFVAYDQGGELRVAGWSSRNRLRPGSKHLCGQTCLHKLVDEFMANAISGRVQAGPDELDNPERSGDQASDRSAAARPVRTSDRNLDHTRDRASNREIASGSYVAAGPLHEDGESSARLITPASPSAPAAPAALRPWPARAHPELVPTPGRPQASPEPSLPGPSTSPAAAADPASPFSSREWRAEAWNRERNRELRNGNADAGNKIRRRAGS